MHQERFKGRRKKHENFKVRLTVRIDPPPHTHFTVSLTMLKKTAELVERDIPNEHITCSETDFTQDKGNFHPTSRISDSPPDDHLQ